jgi:ribose transport system substrate-binding protein
VISAEGKKTIAVIPKSQVHIFWQTVHAGAIAAGLDLGVKVLWKAPPTETDYAEQVRIVEDFITQKVDGIVLAPTDRKALVPYIERAAKEGIPLTIFDSGADTEEYVSFVATDNYQGGVMAAERMAEILGAK